METSAHLAAEPVGRVEQGTFEPKATGPPVEDVVAKGAAEAVVVCVG